MSQRVDFNDLLKWSINHIEDYPLNDRPHEYEPRQLSEEDQRFLLDAMDNNVMDEQKRVKVLLQVLRLPQDPNSLWELQNMNHVDSSDKNDKNDKSKANPDTILKSFQLNALEAKQGLRTILEMRHEDDRRKEIGLDIIGAEYIPGNVIQLEELLKKKLILEKLMQLPALPTIHTMHNYNIDEMLESIDIDIDDVTQTQSESNGENSQAKNNSNQSKLTKIRQARLRSITSQVESELPQYIEQFRQKLNDLKIVPKDELQNEQAKYRKLYSQIRDEKLETLEEMEDRTHIGDNAIGFVSSNGIPIIKQYLLSNDFEIAAEAWRFLGNIVSNQPLCQQKAIEYGIIQLAIEAINPIRYLPSLLAARAFSDSSNISKWSPNNDLAQTQLLLPPQLKSCQVNIDDDDYKTLLVQFGFIENNDAEINMDTLNKLYKFTHFGYSYTKFILPLIKSVLYFITSITNNNSTAQTQFALHHGFVPLSSFLQLGWYYITQQQIETFKSNGSKPTQSTLPIAANLNSLQRLCEPLIAPPSSPKTPNNTQPTSFELPTPSAGANLLLSVANVSENIFKQCLRRVLQIITLFADDEYKVTSSPEICQYLFNNANTYNQISKTQFQTQVDNNKHKTTNIIFGTNLLSFVPTQSQQTPESPPTSNSNKDDGHTRDYFKDPVPPLRLEDPTAIHASFRLKHNLSGGKLTTDGVHVEQQVYLAPFFSLYVPIFFPYTLWSSYISCGDWDREIVIMTERMLRFVANNFYKLQHFDSKFEFLTSHDAIAKRNEDSTHLTLGENPTPDMVAQWLNIQYENTTQKKKYSSYFHQTLLSHVRAQFTHNICPTDREVTPELAMSHIMNIFDCHLKALVTQASMGSKTDQLEMRELNREEISFIGSIKTGLNQ